MTICTVHVHDFCRAKVRLEPDKSGGGGDGGGSLVAAAAVVVVVVNARPVLTNYINITHITAENHNSSPIFFIFAQIGEN